jgi:hypothetical protein
MGIPRFTTGAVVPVFGFGAASVFTVFAVSVICEMPVGNPQNGDRESNGPRANADVIRVVVLR